MEDSSSPLTTELNAPMVFAVCPANIWLLGAVANCNLPANHSGNHKVVIEWSVK